MRSILILISTILMHLVAAGQSCLPIEIWADYAAPQPNGPFETVVATSPCNSSLYVEERPIGGCETVKLYVYENSTDQLSALPYSQFSTTDKFICEFWGPLGNYNTIQFPNDPNLSSYPFTIDLSAITTSTVPGSHYFKIRIENATGNVLQTYDDVTFDFVPLDYLPEVTFQVTGGTICNLTGTADICFTVNPPFGAPEFSLFFDAGYGATQQFWWILDNQINGGPTKCATFEAPISSNPKVIYDFGSPCMVPTWELPIFNPPVINPVADIDLCQQNGNEQVTLNVENGTGILPYSYSVVTPNTTYNSSTSPVFTISSTDGEGIALATVTDDAGCSDTEQFNIDLLNCCKGDEVLIPGTSTTFELTFSNTSVSQLPSWLLTTGPAGFVKLNPAFSGNKVAFNDEIDIDVPLYIEQFDLLKMGEKAEVFVAPQNTLGLVNCTLENCQNFMWQGIVTTDIGVNNGQNVVNTTSADGYAVIGVENAIRDAAMALKVENESFAYLESNQIDNCRTGVFIGQHLQSYQGTFLSNLFSNSSGQLKNPYQNETSNKGIEVWANDGIDLGPGNVFDGLKTGISLWLTNATVTECTFQNLVTEPLNPLNTGIGIYAQGDLGIPGYTPPFTNYTLNVYGMGKDAATPNFSNLRTGIMLRNMSTKEIANNFMNGVAYGVRAQLCHGGNLNINENRFANVSNTGVLFTNNLGAEILIANNNLSGQKTSINPTGVHIAGFSGDASNLLIGLNRFDRFTYGVRMNKVTGNSMDIGGIGAHIWNNDFYSTLSSSANNIHLTACERISISENYIEGAPASTNVNPNSASGITNAKHNGVYLQSTANYWLRCNNFDNLSSAVYSFGSNPTGKDNITTNQMHRHYYGWNLRKFGLDGEVGPVGAQLTSNRNDFNEAPFNYTGQRVIYGFNNTTSLPYNILVLQNGNDGVEGINMLNGIGSNNGNWPFDIDLVTSSVDACYTVPEGDLQMLIDDETYYEETQAIEAINGYLAQTADPMFQEVVDFEAKRKVYKAIEQDTTLLQSNSTFSNFYTQARFQTIGKLNEIENELALLSDSTVLQDSVQVAAIRQSIRTKRESIANYSMHETNEKEVLAIYEEKVLNATDQFTAAEQQFIAGLAHQCPLVAGNGVYLARSLYSLFAEDNELDDALICDGYYKKERPDFEIGNLTSQPTLMVYPNPGTGYTRLNFFIPSTPTGEAKVSIKNVQGQTIREFDLPQVSGTKVLDVSSYAAGIYFVEFSLGNELVSTQKLSVIR